MGYTVEKLVFNVDDIEKVNKYKDLILEVAVYLDSEKKSVVITFDSSEEYEDFFKAISFIRAKAAAWNIDFSKENVKCSIYGQFKYSLEQFDLATLWNSIRNS